MTGLQRFPAGAVVAVLTTEPLDRLLDYAAPEDGVTEGDFVLAPLGPRRVLGVVWGPGEGQVPAEKLRPLLGRLDLPPMAPAMRQFLERAGAYTLTPMPAMLRLATRAPGLGQPAGQRRMLRWTGARPRRMTPARARVLDALTAAPPDAGHAPGALAEAAGVSTAVLTGLRREGVLESITAPRDAPFARLDPARPGRALSKTQAAAAEDLVKRVGARRYGTTLLRGVTGSGKTEVYLEAVAAALAAGRQALVLLPEIALTGAFLARVRDRFGAQPAEWHSGVTAANRRRTWLGVATGEASLVVGARSALFLPFRDLGLIVVDEEHDSSYKQEEGALYHARDMAVLRASLTGAAVVLASATPSLESWANAEAGKYARLALPERFGRATLPETRLLDLRATPPEPGQWLAPPLLKAIDARLQAGEQALLFLNRRGYAPLLLCRACGHQVGCHQCDARMVEHRFRNRLICHQCGAEAPIPTTCPSCGATGRMAALGPGVERVAEEAAARFPKARIAILSSDMAESGRALKARIEDIAGGSADLIIGTQLVAKGHNFPLLTLVGVVDADLGLQGADLRAAERTYQLIRQVSGRAGRADRPGEALLQTYAPEHPVLRAIVAGDGDAFCQAEAAERHTAGAPPYGRFAAVIVAGPDLEAVEKTARALALSAGPLRRAGAEVFGPAPAPVARIRGRHRFRLLVKAPKGIALQPLLAAWRAELTLPPKTRVTLDIDPQSFL